MMQVEMDVAKFFDDISRLIGFYNYYMHDGDGIAEGTLSDLKTSEEKIRYFQDDIKIYKRVKAFRLCCASRDSYWITFFKDQHYLSLIINAIRLFERACKTKGLECLLSA